MGSTIRIGKRGWVKGHDGQPYYSIEGAGHAGAEYCPPQISQINYLSQPPRRWRMFLEQTGLELLNIVDGQGFQLVTNDLAMAVNRILKDYQARHPGLAPQICTCSYLYDSSGCAGTDESTVLAILEWLDHWLILSLETLPEPYIHVP